jgi:hypothetical protein
LAEKDLTLEKALQVAQAMDRASKDASELQENMWTWSIIL